jgi:serine/threonine-protein kinase
MDREARLQELVRSWHRLREQGKVATPHDLCRDCPELAAELARRLAADPLDATGDFDTTPPDGAEPAKAIPQVPGYDVKSILGEGGMGTVWRAKDRTFRRSLAVKMLSEQHQKDADLKRRFLEEAQLMGQLQHPGVPPVHDLGVLPDGRPYFAMKLIKGKTLAALLQERESRDQDRPHLLAIFEHVCQTLAYAHAQGIIHRDLKPANIMVGAFGEVQVMDWGLAKVLGPREADEQPRSQGSTICTVRTEAPDSATQAGLAMGTPAYMAPEQARGEVDRLDERCDVFGLGAILCEVLTGEPPFTGRRKDALAMAQKGDLAPALQRLEQCGADRELVKLAKRCLAADKLHRPAHAGEVKDVFVAYEAAVKERLKRISGGSSPRQGRFAARAGGPRAPGRQGPARTGRPVLA